MPESESERLKRLREKQLTTRDPLAHERKFQRNSSVKEKRMQKPISLKEDLGKIPYSVKLPILVFMLGVIGTIIFSSLWVSPYSLYVGAGATVVAIIFSVVFGNALDLRDDIKKHLK
ncbi:MAG: hypothetical protein HYZ23_01190 [Chloroflexi bacterium]|nr:hypothetical protein [Chloroflexota bacterium]